MTEKLTVRRIAELEKAPPKRDALIPEGSVGGLYLKARSSGGHSWVLRYAPVDGSAEERRRGVTLTLGKLEQMKLDAAREAAIAKLARINKGVDPAVERRQARAVPTLEELITSYHESQDWLQKAPRTRASDESRERQHLVPLLGKLPINRIGPAEAMRFHDLVAVSKPAETKRGRKQAGGPGAARKVLRQLKALLAWARSREILTENRLAGVKAAQDGHRDRILEPDEWQRAVKAMDQLVAKGEMRAVERDVITLLALTGARRDEIRRLRWGQLRLDQGLIALGAGDHKTGGRTGGKSIVLVPEAVEILKRQKKIDGVELVFPGDGGRPLVINRSWDRVRKRAGLGDDVVLHTLRHSLATHGAAAGLSAMQIKAVLGHSNIATSARYVHLAEQRRAEGATVAAAAFTGKKKS